MGQRENDGLVESGGSSSRLDSRGSANTETWRAFRRLTRTLGPTPRALEDWHKGRSRYAVWVLRIDDERVRARQQRVAAQLGTAIVPVHAGDLHVTVWVSGFRCATATHDDDVADAVIAGQQGAVRGTPRVRLRVGAPNAFATCAFFEVHDPHGDLAALRAALSVPGAREVRFAPFQPHVTIGRFADTRDAAPIADTLERLRGDGRLTAERLGDSIADGIVPATLELVELDAYGPDRFRTAWRSDATGERR